MIIQLRGELRLEVGGSRVEGRLPGRLGRALLAYLVLNRQRSATRDELMGALWPASVPRDPAATLSTLLSGLRWAAARAGRGGGALHGRVPRARSLAGGTAARVHRGGARGRGARAARADGGGARPGAAQLLLADDDDGAGRGERKARARRERRRALRAGHLAGDGPAPVRDAGERELEELATPSG